MTKPEIAKCSEKEMWEWVARIGFTRLGMYYRNPKRNDLIIQFVSGPPGIGSDYAIKPREVKVDGQILKIFTPTDCIRDRLAAYIYDRSRDNFDRAVLVALRQPYEAKKIKKWLEAEGYGHVYNEFTVAVKKERSP